MSADPDPLLNTGQAVPLYIRLIGFADVGSRDTGHGYPYRARLASSLSCSKQTVDRATKVLEQEIGLVTVTERKVEGKPDENDANQYLLHDGWLIHGVPAPPGTPPQLVARYGHTVPGFDIDLWMTEHAPSFDRAAWQAAYETRVRQQEEKEAEQRRKERARRKPKKPPTAGEKPFPEGGGVMGDATPQDDGIGGGGVMYDATGGVMDDVTGGVMGDALLSKAVSSRTVYENNLGGSAVGQGAGGFARAGAGASPGGQTPSGDGGSAANREVSISKGKGRRVPTPVSDLVPVAGEDAVYALLDGLGVLASSAARIKTLRRAVREYLGHNPDARPTPFAMYPRTPEHATTRINRKWHRAGGPARAAADYLGPDKILRPVGYLAQLLLEQECEAPNCELGVLVDSGDVCGRCAYLEAARIADAESARLLADEQVDHDRRRVEAAARRQAELDAVYDEAVAANEQVDRIRVARATAAEETASAREEILRDHPELAAYAQSGPVPDVPGPRAGGAEFAQAAGRGRQAAEEERVRTRLVSEGVRGAALDDRVRLHMSEWRADRRREAAAADIAAQAATVPSGWPNAGREQAAEGPF
ncbi:hypothetical protein ACWC5F_31280 [Streptomyces sp. NPDC001272]